MRVSSLSTIELFAMSESRAISLAGVRMVADAVLRTMKAASNRGIRDVAVVGARSERWSRGGVMRSRVATIAAALLLLAAPGPSYADSDDIDFPHLMGRLPPVKAALVTFIEPNARLRHSPTASQIRNTVCRFYTEDKIKIREVIDAISAARLKRVTREISMLDYRAGVFLTLDDNSEVRLLLEPGHRSDATIRGDLFIPHAGGDYAFVGDTSFQSVLDDWAMSSVELTIKLHPHERFLCPRRFQEKLNRTFELLHAPVR